MVFERIEQLQREFTDQSVSVEGARPEFRRFAGRIGQVKTVNMSGRALVQFDGADETWYDIPVEALRIVEKPSAAPSA